MEILFYLKANPITKTVEIILKELRSQMAADELICASVRITASTNYVHVDLKRRGQKGGLRQGRKDVLSITFGKC